MVKFLCASNMFYRFLEQVADLGPTDTQGHLIEINIGCLIFKGHELNCQTQGIGQFNLSNHRLKSVLMILSKLPEQPVSFQVDNNEWLWMKECVIN